MRLWLILFLFLLLLLSGTASAETVKGYDGNSDQVQINEALKKGGDVTLENRVYDITGPINIPSDTTLKGGPDTVLRVSCPNGRWFSPTVGVINCYDPFNVKISGFEIDGNCQNLPSGWANSPGHAHDQEQLIKIIGSSGNFGKNVEISKMFLHNSFGDGIQARFIDGIICSENEIINTQHESIYYSACKNCKMIDNRMSVITSDGGRFDNCVDGEAAGNYIWKYNGTNNNGASKGGANAFQVGDAGVSKGYDGRKSTIHSTDIELHNNTIIDPGRAAFLIDAAGQTPSTNLYIHDNIVVGAEDLETMGIPVDDYSYENPPTQEQSEEVFDSIYKLLGIENIEFVDTGKTEQTPDDIKYEVEESSSGRITGGIKLFFKDVAYKNGVAYISGEDDIMVKYVAIPTPIDVWWNGGISKFEKVITTEIKNGVAYANLTISMKWYTVKENKLTGSKKKKYHDSQKTYSDSCPAPKIWPKMNLTSANATEYRGKITNYTLVSGPSDVVKLVYTYNGTETTHYYMIGERYTDPVTNIESTNFIDVDYWEGDLSHYGDSLYINGTFDPKKLKVEAYSPYESVTLKKEHIIEEQSEKAFADGLFGFIIKTLIYLFGIDRVIRILKN